MAQAGTRNRPLSPHLQIWRWGPGMASSILHRVTGVGATVGIGVLLWGGLASLQYALEYGERRRGLWRPYMAPIKIIMVIGIVMMLLQCTAFLIRDIARLRGKEI